MARDYEGMQEQQWANSQRAAQDGPWAGYDPEVVDYYRSNTPAGFGSWASGMAPGQALDPRQVQEVIGNLNRPGLYEGVNGMTLLQYLADPRAHIKYEDGKFTYAPKTTRESLGNDFKSKDRETFLQSLGAIPMIAGMMLGPVAQMNGFISPAIDAGGINAINGMDAGTPWLSDPSWSASWAADPVTMGSITEAAGGFDMNWPMEGGSNQFTLDNPGLPSGEVSPVNTNLSAGGMNTIDEMINSITSGGAQTVGSVGSGVGEIASAMGTGGAATASAAGAASLLSQISKYLGIPIDEMVKKATGNPFLESLVKGYGIYTAGQANDKAAGIISQGMAQSDPFGSQRQFYQDRLRQSYLDPNFFNSDPMWKGITDTTMNDVSRLYAARGMNDSSNVIKDTARRLADERSKYALNWQNQTGQLAGGGVSPSGVGALAGLGANLATQQGNQQSGNVGSFIRTLPNTIDYLDKTFSGVSPP